jgi:hypothetical protein
MYPRTTVELAKTLSDLGILDRENAAICSVSVASIRHWRRGSRRRRGEGAPRCPRCHDRRLDERAYAYLLGLYLGDGHMTVSGKGVWALSITCCDAWPGLMAQARLAMSAVMPSSKVFAPRKNRLYRDQEHIQALALSVPTAWTGQETPARDRIGPAAGADRGGVSR